EWVHVQLHQQKGMISLSPPTICNSALRWTTPFQRDKRPCAGWSRQRFIRPIKRRCDAGDIEHRLRFYCLFVN
ncbi:hypothetical protein, partial [Salmonella enterica]|uniref:hypothetical protein n=1 Tax=Salmonella enterica TaxID=28901 RepID=UPI00292E7512